MPKNVVGLFDTQEQAHIAVQDLIAAGYETASINVIATDPTGHVAKHTVDEAGDLASSGAVAGGTSGLIIGGLIGLLIGSTTLLVPPAGLILAGPIAATLTGAGLGLVGGTIIGALVGLGVPEQEVHVYAESIRRGSVLVSLNVPDGLLAEAEAIMVRNGAIDIRDRAAVYQAEGFSQFDAAAPNYTTEEIAAERARRAAVAAPGTIVTESVAPTTIASGMAAPAVTTTETVVTDTPVVATSTPSVVAPGEVDEAYFQNDFTSHYPSTVGTYHDFRPAYQFGYELASHPNFASRTWEDGETSAQALWEQTNPGTWSKFRDAIYTGWLRAGSATTSLNTPKASVL